MPVVLVFGDLVSAEAKPGTPFQIKDHKAWHFCAIKFDMSLIDVAFQDDLINIDPTLNFVLGNWSDWAYPRQLWGKGAGGVHGAGRRSGEAGIDRAMPMRRRCRAESASLCPLPFSSFFSVFCRSAP